MKLAARLKAYGHVATPVGLALLLSIALLTGTALATSHDQPPPAPGSVEPPPPPPPVAGGLQPPPSPTQLAPPPAPTPITGGPLPTPTSTTVGPQPTPTSTTVGPPPTPAAHPGAPRTPPADCVVAHAATPAQLCPIAGGLQYYFIAPDGSSRTGPYIHPFSELATLHTTFASLYSGTNPFTGKSVQIHYLPSEQRIRVITFYPDTQYDTNKPYNFTVDSSNTVIHEAW